MGADPFAVLGLDPSASLEDLRLARRRLAKDHHPDHGGDASSMQSLNAAFDEAVKAVGRRSASLEVDNVVASSDAGGSSGQMQHSGRRWSRRQARFDHDASAFTVAASVGEAFEALAVVTTWFGEVAFSDEPSYVEVRLAEPAECWARLSLVAEAGATTVSVAVISDPDDEIVTADDVRDLYVAAINELGSTLD